LGSWSPWTMSCGIKKEWVSGWLPQARVLSSSAHLVLTCSVALPMSSSQKAIENKRTVKDQEQLMLD
jgi:hypothetical protein